MLYSFVKENSYVDSIELMLLSVTLSDMEYVKKATVMMGTKANIDIMKKSGFDSGDLDRVKPYDLVAVVETDFPETVDKVKEAVEKALKDHDESGKTPSDSRAKEVGSWLQAQKRADEFDICLISVPGEYAADEARTALNMGKHVFMFSDNVSIEDECVLKQLAHEKGLLMMGPDCGTAMIGGVPFGFANAVKKGNIGIVGASGTGIQEVAVQIEHMGGGISNAIGTGGRDLSSRVGGITMLDGIDVLAQDVNTDVIVVISKPPEALVAERVIRRLCGTGKPAVVLFLGSGTVGCDFENIRYAEDTKHAARLALELCGIDVVKKAEEAIEISKDKKNIIGLFAGGTLACEAAIKIARTLGVEYILHGENGIMLDAAGCRVIDLGDDCYTQGKPHPMVDGESRNRFIRSLGVFEKDTVVLLDVEIGAGSSDAPCDQLCEALRYLKEINEKAGKTVQIVVNLLGTDADLQNLSEQKNLMSEIGAYVANSNVCAVSVALAKAGYEEKPVERALQAHSDCEADVPGPISKALERLFVNEPCVLNIGLRHFASDLEKYGKKVIHYAWKPVAGGDRVLRRAIDFLDNYRFAKGPYKTIDEANRAVVEKVQAGAPYLMDVVPAYTVCKQLTTKTLLHAGPPMRYKDMTSPMQGSCVGAALFEGWASTEEKAREMLESGEIGFIPCHHVDFVGPMGGITSGHMPVLKVLNRAGGNYAYCTMNEGIGAVLRFGAYSEEVIERLRFMRDVLGPVLSAALNTLPEGLALNTLISKAIAMGDEFHQRNIAASFVFLKEMAPLISALDIENEKKTDAIRFLAVTDQFFLNIMMAAAKSVMDYAANITEGTIVTVMTRNGKDFGVRISGMQKEWFTGPVNTPVGLYFSGYTKEDGNPDMGDSAITETYGVGGMAMIAAPAVTRFVGTGGFYDAQDISNTMSEIVIAHNAMFPIPNWDFKGICNGIDARKVVLTGITPVINTGIAHKEAGRGQIGAGTVHPPMECFSQALLAYAKKLGYKE